MMSHFIPPSPQQRQLLLDREMSRDGLLMTSGTTMSLAWSSEGSFQRSVSKIETLEVDQGTLEVDQGTLEVDQQNEDHLIEVVF